VAPDAVYVQTLKPKGGVAALDPQTGELLWMRSLADVQRLAVANGLLFVLTYGLGQPVRLVVLKADTGAPIGAVVLSAGYYAFPEPNELMIASGLVFIRVVGPRGGQLVVLGL
jgi:outer membrane protein assembly factor BamB